MCSCTLRTYLTCLWRLHRCDPHTGGASSSLSCAMCFISSYSTRLGHSLTKSEIFCVEVQIQSCPWNSLFAPRSSQRRQAQKQQQTSKKFESETREETYTWRHLNYTLPSGTVRLICWFLSALFVAFSLTNSDENTINNRDLCLCWIILTVFLLYCLLFTVITQGSVCLWKEELFNRSQRAFSPRLVYITNTEMTFRFVCLF